MGGKPTRIRAIANLEVCFMKRCSRGHYSPDEALFCMRCGERLPSELDPILFEVTRLVDQLKTLSQKGRAFSQPEIEILLEKLGVLTRKFVETKKRMLVGIPEVDQPTIVTAQQIERSLKDIPDDCKPLILTKVLSYAANAAKSLSEIKRVDLLGRLATALTLSGLEKEGLELFTKLTKMADRSSGYEKADMYACITRALSFASRKDGAVEALNRALDQAKRSRDYSEETAEIAALMGRTDEAIELTRKNKPEYERARALARIACSLALREMTEEAIKTLDRALEIADGIPGKLSRARAQAGLAGALVLVGRMADAVDITDRIGVKSQRSEALEDMAESLALLGKTAEAIKMVNEKFKGTEREAALARVAGAVAALGRTDEALSLSRHVRNESYLDWFVKPKLIRALAFSGRVIEAVEIMNSIDVRWRSEERVKALVDIAEALTLPNAPIYQGLLLFEV